jgi:hypothetical protein
MDDMTWEDLNRIVAISGPSCPDLNCNHQYCRHIRGLRAQLELLDRTVVAHALAPDNWAMMLVQRDDVQGPEALRRMIEWYDEHDGKADDFGELLIVKDARRALDHASRLNQE